MANEIKDKFSASAALTITLASLASSTAGVGRQSTLVDNSSARYGELVVYVKITVGTTPTANTPIYVYLIRSDNDGTDHRTDGAGASDAALTVNNAPLLGVIMVPATTSDTAYYGEFSTRPYGAVGPEWGIAIVQSTTVNLNSTGGNHWVRYIGVNPEVQ